MSKRILVAISLTFAALVTSHYALAQARPPLPETQKTLIDNMFVARLRRR